MNPRFRKWAVFSLFGAGLFLSACDPLTISTVEAVSIAGSDKTVVDHMVSLGSGKDCSTVRRERGLTYCVEDAPLIRQNIYCYRNLGGVTCYDRPDPFHNGEQRVDRNDHNMPK